MKKLSIFLALLLLLSAVAVIPVFAEENGECLGYFDAIKFKRGESIVIDGELDEVYDKYGQEISIRQRYMPEAMLDSKNNAKAILFWDGEFFYVYFEVEDSWIADMDYEMQYSWADSWGTDFVGIYMDTLSDGNNVLQWGITPNGRYNLTLMCTEMTTLNHTVPDKTADYIDYWTMPQEYCDAVLSIFTEGAEGASTIDRENGVWTAELKFPAVGFEPGQHVNFLLHYNDVYWDLAADAPAYCNKVSEGSVPGNIRWLWEWNHIWLADENGDVPKYEKKIDDVLEVPGFVTETEAPATDAPATDAPETEAPATEAPATEAPATEAPETDAPETEAPATEAPETEAPETEAPATEAPETEAPETEAPETEAPETDAPETEAPETEAPETDAPETEAPETEAPATEAPETEAPETEAPETEAPETEAPKAEEGGAPIVPIVIGVAAVVVIAGVAVALLKKKK